MQGPKPAPEEELRQLLLCGAVVDAAARLRQLAPSLADNQWLVFQLKKHQFMHVAAAAAGASKEAQAHQLHEALGALPDATPLTWRLLAALACTMPRTAALVCVPLAPLFCWRHQCAPHPSREPCGEALCPASNSPAELAKRELAPLAMEAYCEAFSEFKHCMLALVSGGGSPGGDGGGSSGSEELSEFAGMVVRAVRAVRQQAGSFADSQLAQLLRYLLLLHRHQAHTGFHPYWWPDISQQTHQLCARLLLPQHDALPPAALEPADDGSRAAEGVREHDVQARRSLMHQQRQPGCCGSLHGCPALPLEG